MHPTILSIGYGRALFERTNPERARLLACSKEVAGLHMVIFSQRTDALAPQCVEGSLFLYPTNSRFRLLMPFDALLISLRILNTKRVRWCITTQDPLASGIVGCVVAYMSGFPLVVQEHADIFGDAHWRRESWSNTFWYYPARYIMRTAHRVRVVGERVKRHVRALGVPEERIHTLPVFSNLHAWYEGSISTDLHARYPDASCIVLSVARFVPQKNLLLLLEAFTMLLERDPSARLVLVGKGMEERLLREKIHERKIEASVVMMPWTEDVASLMKTADIYALSSNYEGWARVLPEAMACGLPAVATDVGCVGEVFIHNRHGLVVPVGATDAFGKALIALASDAALRSAMRERSRADARMQFTTPESYGVSWAAVYRNL